MATVYLAHDLRYDRPVAFKLLRPEVSAGMNAERFRREIATAARLQHPLICSVYDSGEDEGQLWFTMPYVRGETLRARLKREKRLPVDEALRITREAAEALAHAHRAGVVHRDVKPENILLTEDGAPMLADFGIALHIDKHSGEHLTEQGHHVGTPMYMAPEQAMAERAGPMADQFALAAVCYEMLAGAPPHAGPTIHATLARRLSRAAPGGRKFRPETPESVERALQRALAISPHDRFPSIAEFGDALEPGARVARPPLPRSAWIAVAAVLVIAVAGVVLLSRRPSADRGAVAAPTPEPAPQRLAVLPFENLGGPEQDYIVDGITDEIRGKLAGVPGLQVIARASSNEYRATRKPLQDVARELGVRYLLTGTVRSERASGSARVRVAPELVEVTRGSAPVSRWTQTLDATMRDVFTMQADVASRVVGAMNVALAGGARAQLAEAPTKDPAAYDAYLRGKEIVKTDPVDLRRRLTYYQRAVALDSTFTLAWVERARTASILYANGVPDPALARDAKQSAERAIALAPQRGEGYGVLATYLNLVEQDPARALAAAQKARALSPGDPELLRPLAIAERQQGRVDESLRDMRAAVERDPRNAITVHLLGDALLWARRYDEARDAASRALALAPDVSEMIENRAMISLAQGDLADARRVLASVPASVDRAALAAAVAMYYDLPWALDEADQRRLLALGPDAFDGDRLSWAWALSQTYTLRGDAARARAYADTALVAADEQLRGAPDDAQRQLVRGLVLATLGREADAVAAGERGFALAKRKWTATNGPYLQHQLARIHLVLGHHAQALDLLEPLLQTMPYYLSPAWLRIDPTFAPLRGNPRFERLASSKPVVFGR
jgi:serine/threonine-protein kinase